jgi:hypothetical protein
MFCAAAADAPKGTSLDGTAPAITVTVPAKSKVLKLFATFDMGLLFMFLNSLFGALIIIGFAPVFFHHS